MKDLMPIGAFSKVCRLTIKALRHYDELDLLKPAWVDPGSGYRYYSLSQARPAARIGRLRGLHVPLDQVRLALVSPDTFRAVLERHRERVLADLEDQRQTLLALEDLLNESEVDMTNPVLIKQLPGTQLLGVRTKATLAEIPATIHQAFGELCRYCADKTIVATGPGMTIYHDGADHAGADHPDHWDVEVAIPVERPYAGQGRLQGRAHPPMTVAYTLYEGPYGPGVTEAYHALMAWIQAQGLALAGPPRELYLAGEQDTHSPADYRTELQWPVVETGTGKG